MIGFGRCSIGIRQLRVGSLVLRFTLSATKRTARFMLCLPTTRKNWKRRWSNASIIVEKTGDLLRLRQRRQSHLFRPLAAVFRLSDDEARTTRLPNSPFDVRSHF
jgi:hypothetical protein